MNYRPIVFSHPDKDHNIIVLDWDKCLKDPATLENLYRQACRGNDLRGFNKYRKVEEYEKEFIQFMREVILLTLLDPEEVPALMDRCYREEFDLPI